MEWACVWMTTGCSSIRISYILLLVIFSLIADAVVMQKSRQTLPSKICLGYCNWSQADEKVISAVRDGVNVIVWFSVNIAKGEDGRCSIEGGPDYEQVAKIAKELKEEGREVVHLMSIGGWNSPHPDISFTSQEMFEALDVWNLNTVSRPELGWTGFDGFDWDVEGNDDFDSPHNEFSVKCLDTIGELSQTLKRNGYLVAMAPAESYLDPSTSEFSLSLRHNHAEWENSQPNFFYRGRNTYAYLLSRYGETTTDLADEGGETCIDTFDFITIQLYEGYSHGKWRIRYSPDSITPAVYVDELVKSLEAGWSVNFSDVPELDYGSQSVEVPSSKLVIGLANGWAGEPENKFLLITPDELADVQRTLLSNNNRVRGYGFWNMKDEGEKDIYLAKSITSILHNDVVSEK